jgi:drug/metabolite transporter (DMT)-like permease
MVLALPVSAPRARAIAQAVFVTFLWATSWVLVKLGLAGPPGSGGIPPLTFAGLRYFLAWLCLLPFVLPSAQRARLRALRRAGWGELLLLGVLFYALTQGAQFVALKYLPAITVNLLLNFSAVVVAVVGVGVLGEQPTHLQWLGVVVALAGAGVFFGPALATPDAPPATASAAGYTAAAVAVLANAFSATLGRHVNARGHLPPVLVTAVSMGCGALLLLGTGLVLQGLPRLTLAQWAIVLWLAIVNTAVAFTLWSHTQRTLSALESSVINNLLIIQIPLLAWLFLGEALTSLRVLGLALAGAGALLVQLRNLPRRGAAPPGPT